MFKNSVLLNSTVQTQNDESFTVILNSNLGTSVSGNAIVAFQFDWSILPDRNFEVHYSFNTTNMALTSGPVALISSDIFAASNTYLATGSTSRTGAQSTLILGVAYPYIYGTASALHADDSTAPPLYLNTRPNLNQFNVYIQTAAATPVDYPSLGAWVLILRFVPVDKSARLLL